MNRNIYLAYFLTACKHSWFWFGIWIFYYLRFTNYAGIGIIETVLIITMTTMEIPTGAVADLFGKKKTLLLAFLLEGMGAYWYAFAHNLADLVGSVFVMCVGGAFFSGTLEALVYDSLKQVKNEKRYDRVIATINSIQLGVIAVCSLVGGYLYTVHFRLPFIMNAVFYTFAVVATFFLIEPKIDTEKFSFANYIKQTQQGLRQLFKTVEIKRQTLLLLSVGAIVVIMDEMLNSFLGVEFGFQAEWIGVAWAAIYVISAFASQATPLMERRFGISTSLLGVGFVMALSLLLSPVVGLTIGGLSLLIRSILQSIYGNLTSTAINSTTDSRYRATTLSTFNMLKNVPYVLTAYVFGSVTDTLSARGSAFGLGFILTGLLLFQIFTVKLPKRVAAAFATKK